MSNERWTIEYRVKDYLYDCSNRVQDRVSTALTLNLKQSGRKVYNPTSKKAKIIGVRLVEKFPHLGSLRSFPIRFHPVLNGK